MLKKFTVPELQERLKTRIELISRVPSVSNFFIAFEICDSILVSLATERLISPSEKEIDRFEKLRNLALGTKVIPERKIALERAIAKFNAIAFPVVEGEKKDDKASA